MPELPRRIPYTTWPGALAVLLSIAALVGGLMLWDRLTPAYRPLAAGQPLVVGHGVRFVPAPDWDMDMPRTRPGTALALYKGGYAFLVTTGAWQGGPQGPIARQLRLMERGQGLRVEGEPAAFFNAWGLEGQTFAYYGPKYDGRFWQVVDVTRRTVVQIDFRGPPGGLDQSLADAKAMVDSMDLGAP